MISFTIDGKTVQVENGTTVLQAAQSAGIHIPTLCNHPALKPFGGCRLCLVEVEGMRTLQPSCTLPASEKMAVLTSNDKIKAARRFVLSMIFSDRNHFCPFCQVSGGDCELQNSALDEGMSHWPFRPNWEPYPVDASHPFFVMDHNRCILCHRCVRACGQLVGNFTLGIEERGARSMLVADTGVPLGESTCVACGTCVSVCPTGALIERRSAYQGQSEQMEMTKSICLECSLGCGSEVYTRNNRVMRIMGDWEAPVNGGVLCKQGRFMPVEENRERITQPMLRKEGKLQPVSWEEALAALGTQIKPLAGKKGQGVAAIASTRLPAEALSLFKQIFVKHLDGNMVTSTEEGQATGILSLLAEELGQPYEANLQAIQKADCVLAIGVNLDDSHMVAGFFIKRNLPEGTNLILVDPQPGNLETLANVALKPVHGSDSDVLLGLESALVRLGLQDGDAALAEQNLAHSAQATGLSIDDLLAAAAMLGSAQRPMFVYGKGITTQNNLQPVRKLIELARKINASLLSVKGEANSMAAAQYYLDQPFQLNGDQAVYVALGDDTPSQRLVQKLEKAPFLAVQASYVSRLTAMAQVVLPVENWAEQEGHFLNVEGRLQKTSRAVQAPEGVRSNAAALDALAQELGLETIPFRWTELCERPAPVAIAI
jgi:formate dehydrogenase major subunit